jgi:hypothetical protein
VLDSDTEMIVTAWNNGGAGYGVRISMSDRSRYFQRQWKSVFVRIGDQSHAVEINIDKKSFWRAVCGELINKEIGLWFRQHNLAPWPKGNPPKLKLSHEHDNHFHLNKR